MTENESRPWLAGGGKEAGEGSLNPRPYLTKVERVCQEPHGQVVYNGQGHAVGRIEGGWLIKRNLDPERHMLHSPSGWCTDAEHLRLPILGIRLYTVTGEVWEARLELWQRYGQPLDRRWGEQVLLLVQYWHVERREVRQLTLFEPGTAL